MKIVEATTHYEKWLAKQIPLVSADLSRKHALMKQDGFSFLRATCYRWMEVWPSVCAELATAPSVLAVGDLHVENFGTWRDSEGRLIWGINDFDDAHPLPYTNDLVRLAVSAKLAIKAEHLDIKPRDAYDAILTGYVEALKVGGRPFVLAERHPWLRDIATNKLRDPVRFWKKMGDLPLVKGTVPQRARTTLDYLMPERGMYYSLRRRVSGLGTLGRQRFIALAEWHGGKIAREVKALAPSACVWAGKGDGVNTTIMYQTLLDRAVRCRDPFVQLQGNWLVRRLSPFCSRIELPSLPQKRDEGRLLHAMGWETANVHMARPKAVHAIQKDCARRKADWLLTAAKAMTRATLADWKEWAEG